VCCIDDTPEGTGRGIDYLFVCGSLGRTYCRTAATRIAYVIPQTEVHLPSRLPDHSIGEWSVINSSINTGPRWLGSVHKHL
jgi:hypothetical protein